KPPCIGGPAHVHLAANSSILRPAAKAAFNHFGCSPRPLQVSPVAALRYFTATLPPLPTPPDLGAPLTLRSDKLSPYCDIKALTLEIASARSCRRVASISFSRAAFRSS